MSVKIKDNEITMTRGDTMRTRVKVFRKVDDEKVPYIPTENDEIRFALKHPTMNAARTEYIDSEPLILRSIPVDTLILELIPSDTKSLGFGDYVYDIELTMEDGTVDTFIEKKKFTLTPEVH